MQDFSRFFTEQVSLIPNSGLLPSYKVLEMALRAGIEKGLWKTGDLLPPERKMASLCGFSVGTVKRAMLELVHQGVLYRRQGSGTFVAGASFSRQQRRYYTFLKDFNEEVADNEVEVLSVNRIAPREDVNAVLRLSPGEELFEVTRSIREEGQRRVLVRSYLSAVRFAGLDELSMNRLLHVPLYLLLEDDYGVVTVRSEELFGALPASRDEAALLGVSEQTPLLLIKTLGYTHGDQPFEYRISFCVTGERYIYRAME